MLEGSLIYAILGSIFHGAKYVDKRVKTKASDRRRAQVLTNRAVYSEVFKTQFCDAAVSDAFKDRAHSDHRFAAQLVSETNDILRKIPGVSHQIRHRCFIGLDENFQLCALLYFANQKKAFQYFGTIASGVKPLGMEEKEALTVMRWARDQLREVMPNCEIFRYKFHDFQPWEYTWNIFPSFSSGVFPIG